MDEFVELFKKYNYDTDVVGRDIFATNGTYCVIGTIFNAGGENQLCGFSFVADDLKPIKDYYKNRDEQHIGVGACLWHDSSNGRLEFTPFGCIGNHDHSLFEIEDALRHM